MAPTALRRRRCATYTRKSSEEGLEQDFNSLDAQREACDAYIRSQAGEGWTPNSTRYDDGGYSGGTLDRPALQRLLSDIDAGKVDIVVVYKVDRLTRSLADFAKIVEVLDGHGVSFVSVTHTFHTTTSMGRLTLNMLLSFAQFEREVTGERIRDKIAASKRKGMWMGGFVPLGYEAAGRTLQIVEREATVIRKIFDLYLDLGTVPLVQEAADRLGLRTKVRSHADGSRQGGRPLSRGHLYKLLNNPLYVGQIRHKGQVHDGQHPAIIDRAIWEETQRRLEGQAPSRPAQNHATQPSPLRGKLFDEQGAMLTPSHTNKTGRRYRYYVTRTPTSSGTASDKSIGWRLPAREIERLVEIGVRRILEDRTLLTQCTDQSNFTDLDLSDQPEKLAQRAGDLLDLVRRVDLASASVTLELDLSTLLRHPGTIIRHVMSTRIQRRGVERRLVLRDGDPHRRETRIDPTLVKAIARARSWFSDLSSGRSPTIDSIAKAEGISDRYVITLMPLAFLSPALIAQILAGTQPTTLTAEALIRRIDLPLSWSDQAALFGAMDA